MVSLRPIISQFPVFSILLIYRNKLKVFHAFTSIPYPPPHPLTVILLPSPPPLPSFYSLFLNLSLLVFPSLSFSRLLYQLHEHLNKLPECPLFINLIYIKETVGGISSYISFRDGNARIIFTTRGTLGTFNGSVR